MPESLEGFAELQKLRQEVEDLKVITGAVVRSIPDLADKILGALRLDATLARILLLVDGVRSQSEIQELLLAEGLKGASVAGVSRRFDNLSKDLGLIVFDRRTKAGNVYRLSPLAGALNVVRRLEKERKADR